MGPLWKEMPVSRAFSTYPSGSPARKPSLQVPFTELPQREMPHLQRPLTTICRSSWLMDSHGVMSIPWALLPYSSKSQERSSPNRAPTERDAPYLEPSKNTQTTTLQVPQLAPEARDAHLQNFFCTLPIHLQSSTGYYIDVDMYWVLSRKYSGRNE